MKILTMPLDQFIGELDTIGVEKTVILNLDEESLSGIKGSPNDYYTGIVTDIRINLSVWRGSTPPREWMCIGQSGGDMTWGFEVLPCPPFRVHFTSNPSF